MHRTDKRYQDYIHSETWRKKSELRREWDNYRCCMCGCCGTMFNPLQTHHVRYPKVLGTESVERDLMTLCQQCHSAMHRALSRKTNKEGRHGWKDGAYVENFTSVLQVNEDEYQVY